MAAKERERMELAAKVRVASDEKGELEAERLALLQRQAQLEVQLQAEKDP